MPELSEPSLTRLHPPLPQALCRARAVHHRLPTHRGWVRRARAVGCGHGQSRRSQVRPPACNQAMAELVRAERGHPSQAKAHTKKKERRGRKPDGVGEGRVRTSLFFWDGGVLKSERKFHIRDDSTLFVSKPNTGEKQNIYVMSSNQAQPKTPEFSPYNKLTNCRCRSRNLFHLGTKQTIH
jgi:hypothetical protein